MQDTGPRGPGLPTPALDPKTRDDFLKCKFLCYCVAPLTLYIKTETNIDMEGKQQAPGSNLHIQYLSTHIFMICSLLFSQIPVPSHWTQTQHINTSVCLMGTERQNVCGHSLILTILKDSINVCRCCVKRTYLHAVTGRQRGVVQGFIQHSPTKMQGAMLTVDLDAMTSPGACNVIMVVIFSNTIMLLLPCQAPCPQVLSLRLCP